MANEMKTCGLIFSFLFLSAHLFSFHGLGFKPKIEALSNLLDNRLDPFLFLRENNMLALT